MKTSTLLSTAAFALAATTTAVPLDLSSGHSSLLISVDVVQNAGAPVAAAVTPAAAALGDIFTFTSQHTLHATPEQVVNETTPTGGIAGASGIFSFGINSALNIICYNITLHGFQGEFSSPADTATHIHEAALGASGPPRIAFPNPEPLDASGAVRNSIGCLTGPFTVGVLMMEKDTGEGFHVSQIEQNPAGFMADTHSSVALPGAVRGQFA
ncbi:hypothetical protein BDV95DRAFT_564505 [Massariosphaeria phaeospora]|uniref:CHRD domain-containing protein n=1 Tax=Massariosphaeria phaeospora TaxID=100035 RepID=A0A7C8MCZ4_9PLEO|nr:hypothetical protein BDV95DRAFT_564505 [Massariosphaeria phaeospora]